MNIFDLVFNLLHRLIIGFPTSRTFAFIHVIALSSRMLLTTNTQAQPGVVETAVRRLGEGGWSSNVGSIVVA